MDSLNSTRKSEAAFQAVLDSRPGGWAKEVVLPWDVGSRSGQIGHSAMRNSSGGPTVPQAREAAMQNGAPTGHGIDVGNNVPVDAAAWATSSTTPDNEAAIQAIFNTGRGNLDGSISFGTVGHSGSAQIGNNTLPNIPPAQVGSQAYNAATQNIDTEYDTVVEQLGRTVPLLHEILDVEAAAPNASGGNAAPLPDLGLGAFAEDFTFDFSATVPDRQDEQFVFDAGPVQQQQQQQQQTGVEGASAAQGEDKRRDTRLASQIRPGSDVPGGEASDSNALGSAPAPPPGGQQNSAGSLETLMMYQ
nr:hypothetical protein B0A51_03541 [Rachicladosporium sp. CCFEE 5018]